jgi:hypothetical protein
MSAEVKETANPNLRVDPSSGLPLAAHGESLPLEPSIKLTHFHVISVLPLSKAHSPPETQEEDLDLSPLPLDEVVQLICEFWERGLKDSMSFRILLSQMKELLAEGAERKALEDAEHIQTLVESGREEDRRSSWGGFSDAISMVDSEYTVRSIRSFKERTNYFFRPRPNTSSHRAVPAL